MKIELCKDLSRINDLMSSSGLNKDMAQYDDISWDIQELGSSHYLILSDNNEDIGLFIFDPMPYHNHYNIHVGFIKSARGPRAFIGGMLMLDFIKNLLPHGTLLGLIPSTKFSAVKFGISIGFTLAAIVPHAIEIGDKHNNDGTDRADMNILTYNW